MRFSYYLLLLLSTFFVCLGATRVDSPSGSKKMEVKKALNRLRRVHKEERIVPPVAAYVNLLHSSPSTSTQSSQILHAVENNTPLPKAAKAVIAVVSVGLITGAIVGIVMLTKMLNKATES